MARITAVANLHILKFSGGTIQVKASGTTNGVYDQYPAGNWYLTQRPGVNIFEDASAEGVTDNRGRGVYYWNAVGAKYFVNDDTVYKAGYSAPLAATLTAGTERVYFFEIGAYLVILDPENDEGWYINSATSTTLTQIADADFTGITLANGGAVVNGRLYAYATDGDIIESDLEDPTAWNPLNFRNSELEPDGGVIMDMHHEHVVAIGNRSLEFFYDAANPVGSSLNPRTDIAYRIGAVDDHSFWSENDLLFWLGLSPSGGVGVYALDNFQYRKVSTEDIDTFLNSAITVDDMRVLGSGFQVGGRTFYMLTLYNLVGTTPIVTPTISLCYEIASNQWYLWELAHDGIDHCPVVDWTKTTTTRIGEGILANGDLITIADDRNPQDTVAAGAVFESGVFEPGVFSATEATGNNIPMESTLGKRDFGTRRRKFQGEAWMVGTPTDTSQTLTLQWSNNSDDNFNTGKTIDTSEAGDRINRLGSFRERNYKLSYSGNEQIEIEGIETQETAGV